ncbi:EAL domain-containing protein [Lactobacillus sp.]|uniref:GGDEF domain-containing protein n=1 Tax=Lactobacillus sp. TaxID=1591 RepID=UPI003EFBF10D
MRKNDEQAELARIAESEAPIALYQLKDNHIKVVAVSKGLGELYGLPAADLKKMLGQDLFAGLHPDDLALVQADFSSFVKQETGSYEKFYRIKLPGQKEYSLLQAQGKVVELDQEPAFMVWYTEMSPSRFQQLLASDRVILKAGRNQAKHLRDDLTGLPKAAYFYELAEQGCRELFKKGKQPVMLAFNLIGFSHFNRRYSYVEGNRLLAAFADLLRRNFGEECCGHFTEDNFYAFTEHENLEDRLAAFLKESRQINGGRSLSVRIGIYDAGSLVYEDIKKVCEYAAVACNDNRKDVNAHVAYFTSQNRKKLELENYILSNFDQALKEGWIEPFYQPIVRILNGQSGNWEALARWRKPNGGLLLNEQFIPILDKAGVLYQLDLYMADKVIADLKKMQGKGYLEVAISLNLFSSEFDQCNMAEEISRKVKASGLSPEFIVIEISNDTRNLNADKIREQIYLFKEKGFSVWVDNFGEGYSSIGLIKDNSPVSCIKFDASFIKDPDQKRSKTVLKKMVELAEELSIDTIVEGVENADQLLALREIGCAAAQGYYFGQPLPFDQAVKKWIEGPEANMERFSESDYYNSVGMMSLERPHFMQERYNSDLTFDDPDPVLDRYFKGTPLGFLEYRDGKLYYLRGNEGYTHYLISCGSVTKEEMEEHPFATELKSVGPQFFKDLKGWIDEEYWKSHKTEWHYSVHSYPNNLYVEGYQRILSYNPHTDAYALIDVLTSYNANQVYHDPARGDLGVTANFSLNADQYRDMPIPFIILSPIYREKKVVDMQYIYVNQAYAEIMDQSREKLLGNKMSNFVKLKLDFWIKEIFASDAGQIRKGIFHSKTGHWYEYITAKASVPGTRSLVMINIDEQKRSEREIQQKQNTTNEIVQLSEILNVENDQMETAINKGLAKLGLDLGADRVVVMEGENDLVKNTYCWNRPGLKSAQKRQQQINLPDLDSQLQELVGQDSMFLADQAEISLRFPGIVATYDDDYQLKNVLLAPFYERGRIRGTVVVENLDAGLNMDFHNLIELAADFVGAKVMGLNLVQQRDTDVLTKLNDRHPYLAKLNYYKKSQASRTVGVAFMDLNGLKEANDELGHDAGDELLISAGQIISQAFGRDHVYRVGGDEFVVLDDQSSRMEFEAHCAAFEKSMTVPGTPSISIGAEWCPDSHYLQESVERADRKMQRQKNDFYKSHKRYR